MIKAIKLRMIKVITPINRIYFSFLFSSFCLFALNVRYNMNESAIDVSRNVNLM